MQVGAIVGCMACLLQRLAYGHSLSAESRGGGSQSNARLLPYLIQLAQYFAGFCSDSDLQVTPCFAVCMRYVHAEHIFSTTKLCFTHKGDKACIDGFVVVFEILRLKETV